MTDIGERLVDSMNRAYGVHAGQRAAHAKGVLCAATFTPTPEAAALSRAAHFAGPPVRAHVRFSNGNGNPTLPDGARDGRGMAIKFYVDGATTDIVALSLPVFFARTPEDLLDFNAARAVDPATGGPDPGKVGAYLTAHPEAVAAVTAAMTHPIPASYGALAYHALHAFGFESTDGTIRWGRYHLEPSASADPLTDEEAAAQTPDYLAAELASRLDNGTVSFAVVAQLAAEDDARDDPTAEWPADRERIPLGVIDISSLAHDREMDGDVLVFDPTRVIDGIVCSNDPILHARSSAYRVSVARRTAR
jgi:catalase